ncbi:tetratricopeptide repeat protein [Sporosarcina sp. 179-K 8C2 HS]|uniref:tetratricopeptide repeat protein n=1 Tax=Sporosarcina sp. 179-K 8C2 HS TaxID=3142387 RepID=UPI00399EEBEF
METIEDKLTRAFELFNIGKLFEAEEIYNECLNIVERTSEEYISVLHGLGFVKAHQKEFNEARNIYLELKQIAQFNRDTQGEHIAIHQLGMVERMAENYTKAQDLFEEELSLLRERKPAFLVGFAANHYELGLIMLKQNMLEKAEKLMMQSLQYSKQSGDPICLGCSLRGLGEIFMASRENEKAMFYFVQSIKAFEEVNDEVAINQINSLLEQI